MRLFISYSRDDKTYVYALKDELQMDYPVWIDTQLVGGTQWWESILHEIEAADCVIAVLSQRAVDSIYCRAELDYALALNKPVLPLLIKSCDYPKSLNDRHIQYVDNTSAMDFQKVLRLMERAIGRIQLEIERGKFQPQSVPRPALPEPSPNAPEHAYEIFAAAEDAAAQDDLTLAESLFNKVVKADPQGLGLAAVERLATIRAERDRAVAYLQITKMASDLRTLQGAKVAWRAYIQKHGGEYDPQNLAAKLSDAPPAVGTPFLASAVPPVAVTYAPPTPSVVVAKVGPADFRTINDALKNAPADATIRVRPGLYRESLRLTRPVEIIGDGNRDDIIIESSDTNVLKMETDYTVVRGLTLRLRVGNSGKQYYGVDIPGGRLILEDCDITSDSLACIGIHNPSADPVIRQCRIHDGKETGVYVYENGAGLIEDCEVWGNAFNGVSIRDGAKPTVRQCRIHDGKSAGVYVNKNGAGLIEDCEIWGNGSAGVAIREGGNPTVRQCRIHDGKQGGVMVYENATGLIEDCEIWGNTYTGVEIKTGGAPTVRNCQVNKNKGSGIYAHENARGTVEDCDLRENGGSGAFNIDATSTVTRRNNQEK